MRWWPSLCRSGDMIRVQIGAIWHYGIYISDTDVIQFGKPPRGTLMPPDEVEVCSTDIEEFSGGSSVEVARYTLVEKLRKRSNSRIVQAAKEGLGKKGYDVLTNNCEHFAMECVFGKPSSSQVDAAFPENKKVTEVWVHRVCDDQCDTDIYPPMREKEIKETADQALKRQRIADWNMLSCMINDKTGKKMEEMEFSKKASGKWMCKGLCFSLTHSEDWVAVAVSDDPVGVDIEVLSEENADKLKSALSHVLTDDEMKTCSEFNSTDLQAIWTRKESYFKRLEPAAFEPNTIPFKDIPVKTYLSRDNNWCLSLSAVNDREVRLYMWDGNKKSAAEVTEWRC